MTKRRITHEIAQQLHYLDTEGLVEGEYQVPDFLIIGPQRTGTTWLSQILMDHPEVFIPAEKEIYFFNYLVKREHPRFQSARLEWYAKKLAPRLSDFVLRNRVKFAADHSLAALDLDLIGYFAKTLIGEATASYAAMDEGLIDDVLTLHPNVKALLSLRNPVSRAWSHAKMELRGRRLEDVPFAEFEAFYTDPYQLACAEYTKIIDNWESRLGPGRLFIGIFDEIQLNPDRVLSAVSDFLGIRKLDLGADTSKAVNATGYDAVPDAHHAFLLPLFQQEMQRMNERFGLDWR